MDIGKRIVEALALAHLAAEVHHQPVGTAPSNLDANGKRAVRVERQRYRRLPNAPAHAVLLENQTVFCQSGGDESDGLRGEAGKTCQIRFGQTAVEPNRLQYHPLIELAHAHMVGATRA